MTCNKIPESDYNQDREARGAQTTTKAAPATDDYSTSQQQAPNMI